jgi:hypothetical protein
MTDEAPHPDRTYSDTGQVDLDPRALTDRLLLEQGRLDPLELLLAADLISYADYEAWRLGRRPDLQGALRAPTAKVIELLTLAGDYARGQGLGALPLEHLGWERMDGALTIGPDPELTRLCAAVYAPPADRPQLDLFQDSSGLLIEAEIRHALGSRRAQGAQEGIGRLMQQEPGNRRIAGYLRLAQALEETTAGPGEGGAGVDPARRLDEIQEIQPLAVQLLGARARDLLALLWTDLAGRLADRPFDPRRPRLHAAECWAAAGRWEDARAAVESDPRWRDRPELIGLHARASWQRRDVQAARRDWLVLCWEHPGAAERSLASRELPDARLAELWSDFQDADVDLDTEDFPAWLLVREPAWASWLPPSTAPADQRGEPFRLLHRLAGHGDDIEARRALGDVHPGLLELYLAARVA